MLLLFLDLSTTQISTESAQSEMQKLNLFFLKYKWIPLYLVIDLCWVTWLFMMIVIVTLTVYWTHMRDVSNFLEISISVTSFRTSKCVTCLNKDEFGNRKLFSRSPRLTHAVIIGVNDMICVMPASSFVFLRFSIDIIINRPLIIVRYFTQNNNMLPTFTT